MKPDMLCIVDMDGNQVAGRLKRSSEILLHLAIMKSRPDIKSCVHCHPPHATAFAVAHEPIPKCTMPEFEVFLGEVAITPYETPGTQQFADTILPYIKDTETILLANHGTITCGTDLMDAYFKTEIIDAYCRILLLSKQLGRVYHYSDAKAAELIKIKPGLNVRDVRNEKGLENCDLCGNSMFREGYSSFQPEPYAFIPPKLLGRDSGPGGVDGADLCDAKQNGQTVAGCGCPTQQAAAKAASATNGQAPAPSTPDFEKLVKLVTDQVMSALSSTTTTAR
jgi:L-fuculose-phosphate aldolase